MSSIDGANNSNDEVSHTLDLSNQELSTLPSHINIWITNIDLSGNNLADFPSAILELSNLEILDLSNNYLTSLDPAFGSLKNLKTLSFKSNKLSLLPASFSQLSSLEECNLGGNNFAEFPSAVLHLCNLKALYLGGNQISSLPETLGALVNLEVLYLGGNRLKFISDSISLLSSLTSLSLAANRLESLPSSLGNLKSLRSLAIHDNFIRVLPSEIVTLTNLTSLSLRNNPLLSNYVLPDQVDPPSLKELAARCIRSSFDGLSYEARLPGSINQYLSSASTCINPECKSIYFEANTEHVKFIDLCGKFHIPVLHRCPNCSNSAPVITTPFNNVSATDSTFLKLLSL